MKVIHSVYFKCEKHLREPGSAPPVFDWIWEERNFGTRVLQLFSQVLTGEHPVFRIAM